MKLCQLKATGKRNGGIYVLKCDICGREYVSRKNDPAAYRATCMGTAITDIMLIPHGPGTELTALFAELEISEKPGCNCRAVAAEMDRAGVAGCREWRDYFLAKLDENARLYSWWEKLRAGGDAWMTSSPLSLGGLFDEAIRRAEIKDAWQPIRNCIYHVCALRSNEIWRKNLDQLKRRWELFNGRRVLAYSTGEACHPLPAIRSELPECTIIEVPNDPILREVASFIPLLREVENRDSDQVTFFGHTKGNSTAENVNGAIRWRNAMYHHLLDRWEDCRRGLLTHAFVGTHKMQWHGNFSPYPSRLKIGNWMHAGTFFWFRHDRVFTKPGWWEIPSDRYAAEAWPSMICKAEEAFSIYQPWPDNVTRPNPYDPNIYSAEFDD